MRKHSFLSVSIIVILLSFSAQANARSLALASKLPTPCIGNSPEVYLVIDGTRRHIVDWDTFLNLGYQSSDIIPCGAAANSAEGSPITRLFKGSDATVYLMQNGVRRHIPDMPTFTAMGFQTSDITILPDDVLALWSLGKPLDELPFTSGTVYQEIAVSNYTIRLWHPTQGLTDFATITTPVHTEVRVADVKSIGALPKSDITGDGYPAIEFLTNATGGSHCCVGTIVYNLGPTLTKVLDVAQYGGDQPLGFGKFKDLNSDGVYEFITPDALLGVPCTQPTVTAILQYDAVKKVYVAASPHFASYYADNIAQLSATLKPGTVCNLYPLITTLLYLNKIDEAKSDFDNLYRGNDATSAWNQLVSAVQNARFYVPLTN